MWTGWGFSQPNTFEIDLGRIIPRNHLSHSAATLYCRKAMVELQAPLTPSRTAPVLVVGRGRHVSALGHGPQRVTSLYAM